MEEVWKYGTWVLSGSTMAAISDQHGQIFGTVERCHRYRAALGMLGGTSLRLGSAVKTPSSEVTVFGFSAYLSLDLSMSLTKDWP